MLIIETIHHGGYVHCAETILPDEPLTADAGRLLIEASPYRPPVVTLAMGAKLARSINETGSYDLGWIHWEKR